MLFVGDILQLPSVNGTPVFQQVPNKVISLRLGSIGSLIGTGTLCWNFFGNFRLCSSEKNFRPQKSGHTHKPSIYTQQ